MDKNLILTSEGARQFTNALELLNTSIKEFNQIADKMIPESLLKQGLSTYLHEFCGTLQSENGINVEFVCNEHIRANEEIEIALFRSFRNILLLYIRFSQPAFIRVQLTRSENFLSMVISDSSERNIFLNPEYSITQELQNVKDIISSCLGIVRINTLKLPGNEIEIQVPV